MATLTLYARLAKLLFRTAGRKGTGRGFRARGLAPIFPSPSLSKVCHACYAIASLSDLFLAPASRNPPWRGGGTHDGALMSDCPFDFWWRYDRMGYFRKKYPANRFQRKTFLARKYLGEKFLHWKKKSFMMYNSGKKILLLCMSVKKILSPEVWETNYYLKQITHSPLSPNPQKSNGRPLRTFLSARLAHNVFIVSLPAWQVGIDHSRKYHNIP